MSQFKTENSFQKSDTAHYVDDSLAIVNAIRSGEVDAFVVCAPDGDRVYTLGTGEPPYQRMIEEMKEGAALLTPDGDILYCNSHLAKLLGSTAEELAMLPLSQWITPGSLAQFDAFLNEIRTRPHCVELHFVAGDGPATPVLLTGSAMQVDGTPVVCTTVSDLSLYYQTKAERTARDEAERENNLKDQYLATVSHELRNPLNVIVSWTATLRSQIQNPDVLRAGLDAIERNARVQAKIIDDILDMNRITANSLRLEMEALDLGEVVRAALGSVMHAADDKHITIGIAADPVVAWGDPNRLDQVVCNILSNAIKFTPEHGTIDIAVREINGRAELRISDSGEGIHPEFLPHVFERFRQADASLTRRFSGLGLGLAIVKELVERHNGQITAQSEGPGKGATFVVTLPLASRSGDIFAGTASMPDVSELKMDLRDISIMVVDDDADSCEAVRRFLSSHRASVAVALSAEDALQKMACGFPDVLISDIAMPEVDGYEFVQSVRRMEIAQKRRLSAIALTAFARPEDRDKALLAGYDLYLSKPVEFPSLISAIQSLYSGNSRPNAK